MSAVPSQSCSEDLIVISANIEGLSANKASMLTELCKRKHGTVCFYRKPIYPQTGVNNIDGFFLLVALLVNSSVITPQNLFNKLLLTTVDMDCIEYWNLYSN